MKSFARASIFMEPFLPHGLPIYEHQVAGHGFSKRIEKNPIATKPQLLHSPAERCVYKPIQSPPKGDREVDFYREVFSCNSDGDSEAAAVAAGLRQFLPPFGGVYRCSERRYLRLGDLLHNFVRPSVMDLKMGAKSYEPNATEAKRALSLAQYEHREAVGFLVTGLRVWREDAQEYEHLGKLHWTKQVTPENAPSTVLPPLLSSVPGGPHRRRALRQLLCQLERLQRWFEWQTRYHFYASSVLLAVESCPAALDDASLASSVGDESSASSSMPDDELIIPPRVTALDNDSPVQAGGPVPVSGADPLDDSSSSSVTGSPGAAPNRPAALAAIVDFTHVVPGNGCHDENYLLGLRNLIQLLRGYQQSCCNADDSAVC